MTTLTTYTSLRDASAALAREPSARFLGGGTLLVRSINEGSADFDALIHASDPVLSEVRTTGSRIRIGAGVTMAAVLANAELTFLHPCARAVGGPAVRAQATIGGNLFAPSPYGDFATALLALDAKVAVQSGYSPRDVPIEDFLRERDTASRSIVVSIEVPRPRDERAFRFLKVARVHPRGAAVMSIAALLNDSGGGVSGARVAYGAMAPTPVRARAVERALDGRRLEPKVVESAAAVALDGCTPATDAIASSWYRREVAPVHLARLLSGAR